MMQKGQHVTRRGRQVSRFAQKWCWALLVLPALAWAGALSELPLGRITIDGRVYQAHIADDSRKRGQGFQHVPEPRMRQAVIYFRFPRPQVPSFHMRNVTAPLAIAWIDRRGRVIGVDIMQPGSSGHRPPAPVLAALEVHPDRLEALGLAVGVTVRFAGDP